MAAIKNYRYEMGFSVDGVPIPDPSVFSGIYSDLDASGARDATGSLHRDMVAEKHPIKIEYNALDWDMLGQIIGLLRGKESFTFTYPDPVIGKREMTAYTGDREYNCIHIMNDEESTYVGSLKFSVIEF